MKTTYIGRDAEAAVADLLKHRGYEVLAQNWRTRTCEIDIIAKKAKIIYFVEVKYRTGESQGNGFEYITPQKLRQMRYAAEVWINDSGWSGDWRLMGAAVSGLDYDQLDLIEI